jgi:penicillin-binding protein 2
MGIDNIAKYSNMLGLGLLTGIGLRERQGLVPSSEWKKRVRHEDWYAGETISCSIGQGYVNVTPIQLARMVGTIMNGGTLYQPQVVKGIRYKDGSVMTFPTVTLGKAPVKQASLDIIKDGMSGVVEEPGGTAHAAKSEYVKIGGKTGTAQVIALGKSRGKDYADHAWFVAGAPMDKDPKIAVCILVEHGGHGGSAAAPLAKKVIEAYLRVDDQSLAEKYGLKNMTGATLKKTVGRFKNMTGLTLKKALNEFKNGTTTRPKTMVNRTGAAAKAKAAAKTVPAKTAVTGKGR